MPIVGDESGKPVAVKSASWRAGGVQSAKMAGLSDGTIMALGRWSSIAWTNYVFASVSDLQKATGSTWSAACRHLHEGSSPFMVGNFSPSGIFEDTPPPMPSGMGGVGVGLHRN